MFKNQIQRKLSIFIFAAATFTVTSGFSQARGPQQLTKTASKQPQRGVTPPDSAPASAVPAGSYYALVIGNNDYKYVNKLQTAVNDAQAVAQMLEKNYGFTAKPLLNATRDQILTAMSAYRHTLPQNSNLLIYYAGHGYLDREADEAYWFPVDAQAENSDHWISASDITSAIRTIPSMHILVISDSCYSGALMRDVESTIRPEENSAYIAKMLASKSRNLMSSGGVEPVADGGGGAGHSIFANALLESLSMMEDNEFTAADLFQKFVKRGVAGRSKQVPQYSFIRDSGDEFGDFIFYRPKGSKAHTEGQKQAGTFRPPTINIPATDMDISKNASDSSNRANNSVKDSDRDAIKDVLRRYKEAYSQRDMDALLEVWPGMPPKDRQTLDGGFKSARSIKMSLEPGTVKVAPDGRSATVKAQMSELFVSKAGDAQPPQDWDTTFSLAKTNGRWIILERK